MTLSSKHIELEKIHALSSTILITNVLLARSCATNTTGIGTHYSGQWWSTIQGTIPGGI